MALENARWIYELQKTNPAGTDVISEGDNHLRMIKEVLKDSFPSAFDGPQIPDISGKAGHILRVNDTATGVEWYSFDQPAYPALEFYEQRGEQTTVAPDTWTTITGVEHTIDVSGTYLLVFGINKVGTGQPNLTENAVGLTVIGVLQQDGNHAYQNNEGASYNFLTSSEIIELQEDDVIRIQAYQDNLAKTPIVLHEGVYLITVRLS